MKKLLFSLIILITLSINGQGIQKFDAMDIMEYNATLHIFQITTKKKIDIYTATLDPNTRTMTIERRSDGLSLNFEQITLFREEGRLFVFSGFLIDNKDNRKYPASGFITDDKLRINLGDFIYIFYYIERKDSKL